MGFKPSKSQLKKSLKTKENTENDTAPFRDGIIRPDCFNREIVQFLTQLHLLEVEKEQTLLQTLNGQILRSLSALQVLLRNRIQALAVPLIPPLKKLLQMRRLVLLFFQLL